jgi:hypothetical protein
MGLPFPPEHLRAIGAAIVQWGILESQIDHAIAVLGQEAPGIPAALKAPPRPDFASRETRLKKLAAIALKGVTPGQKAVFDGLIREIDRLKPTRDKLAHGQLAPPSHADLAAGVIRGMTTGSDKRPEPFALTLIEIESAAAQLATLNGALSQFIRQDCQDFLGRR